LPVQDAADAAGAATILHREVPSDTIAVERPSLASVASYAATSLLLNLEMRGSFMADG